MACQFTARRRVEFAETDTAGIMHFSNFFRWMEQTEHAFIRSLGLSIQMEIDGQHVSWPCVHTNCTYKSPLRFEDEVDVHLIVREMGNRSIRYDFQFRKIDQTLAATGSITGVCVSMHPVAGNMTSINIPQEFSDKIKSAPENIIKQFQLEKD